MVGPNCCHLFNVVIVWSDKPKFFTNQHKLFQKLDEKNSLHLDHITGLEKVKIYHRRNLFDFLPLTEWGGP